MDSNDTIPLFVIVVKCHGGSYFEGSAVKFVDDVLLFDAGLDHVFCGTDGEFVWMLDGCTDGMEIIVEPVWSKFWIEIETRVELNDEVHAISFGKVSGMK